MNYPADLHVHSTFSCDAHDSLEAMCRAAIAKGLRYICFTEHLDLNPYDTGYGFFDYPKFSAAIDQARAEFGDQITILKGLEFGEPQAYPRELEEWNRLDFDLILGAVHIIDNTFVGDKSLLERYPLEQLMEKYYTEVLQAVQCGGFDVLAHLDFPKRYLKEIPAFPNFVRDILMELVNKGIALEINTSPLRKGLPECSPDLPIIREYRHLGGTRLTIGSDAHSVNDVQSEWEKAFQRIETSGFTAAGLGVFQKRRFTPLPKK